MTKLERSTDNKILASGYENSLDSDLSSLKWLVRIVVILPIFLLGLLVVGIAHGQRVEPYAGCYTDFDGFVLAIGADMRLFRKATGQPDLSELATMSDAAYKLHKKAIVPTANGWLFQPGAYEEHPDFAFAGWNEAGEAPTKASVSDIAWDSSHFSRWALWLTIYEQAESMPARQRYFRELRRGLAKQFKSKVLTKPDRSFPAFRLKNYMDGRNGFFRRNSDRQNSFGPYQLSGTFVLGWWAFLDDEEISAAYRQVSNAFPLSDEERIAYFGGITRISNDEAKHLTRLAGLKQDDEVGAEDLRIWSTYEARELEKQLWVGELAQSSYHDLMLPMHIAFRKNLPDWQAAFASQFSKFHSFDGKKMSLLNEMHYLHFISRFLVLSAESGNADLIPRHLPSLVERRILELWRGDNGPISQTGWGEPEFRNFKSYLAWKDLSVCPKKL